MRRSAKKILGMYGRPEATVSAAKLLSGDVHSTNSATNGVVAAGEMP
jgi:hypothetical protein